jgi:phage shock protein A
VFLLSSSQVREAIWSRELLAAQQAMTASQQQLQQEQQQQESARQQLEEEVRGLRQQLDKSRADASLARGVAEQAQTLLRKMLVQVSWHILCWTRCTA